MKGDKVSPRELRTYQDWVVSRQLRLVPGVADVVTLGGLVKQYEVRPDPARMRDYKVTLSQLSQAIQRGNRSEEHTSELQSLAYLVCRLLLEKKKKIKQT